MSGLGGATYGLLVDLDAETRAGPQGGVTVHEAEGFGVHDVLQQVALLVVVDAHALFLDEEVRYGEGDLEARGQGDRAEGAVRCQGDVVRLGHGRDAADLGDTAGVREVGPGDGDAAGHDLAEVPTGVEALAGREGDARGLHQTA